MTAPVPTDPPAGDPSGGPTGTPPADRGYPEGTPVDQMTAEQQAAYWKHHSRKWEGHAKAAPSPEELQALRDKAAQYDQVRQGQMTDLQRLQAEVDNLKAGNAALTDKVSGYDLVEMRRAAVKNAELPTDDHVFITANTPEEAAQQAALLKQRVGASTVTVSTGHDQGHRRQPAASGRDAGMAEAQRRGYVKTPPT